MDDIELFCLNGKDNKKLNHYSVGTDKMAKFRANVENLFYLWRS
jgi:hypothetical protein